MVTASEDLRKEHQAILVALNVLEKMYQRVRDNENMDYTDAEDMIGFLKLFADKCHHGKEENILFPALEEIGVKKQNGPIGVMLAEHTQGREFIAQMNQSIENRTIDKQGFVNAASSYIDLLRHHIEKENTILFKISDARLPALKQEEILNEFENLERDVIGEGKHEELHGLLEKFRKKYLE